MRRADPHRLWDGLDRFFVPESEIIVGHDTSDAVAALQRSDAELAQIAAAARERTLEEHTADRRAAELEAGLESAIRAEAAPAGLVSSGLSPSLDA